MINKTGGNTMTPKIKFTSPLQIGCLLIPFSPVCWLLVAVAWRVCILYNLI